MDALKISPYMEAYELHNMKLGVESAAYRFFTLHVLTPAVRAINDMDKVYEDTANATKVSGGWLRGRDEGIQWGCFWMQLTPSCDSPEHLGVLRARCTRCLPGPWNPLLLVPAS